MKNTDAVLAEVLKRILDGVDSTVGFMKEQIPDVLQQLLTYTMYKNIFILTALFCLCSFLIVLSFIFNKKRKKEPLSDFYEGATAFCFTFAGFFFIVFVGCCIHYIPEIIQIAVAPKLFLLEYARSFLK